MRRAVPIVIDLVQNDKERQEALEFIDQKYLEIFETTPPLSQNLFTARCGVDIVGTMGTDFCNEKEKLRLEKIYQFDHHLTPFPVIRDQIAEYGRWVATVPDISKALLYAAIIHARSKRKIYGWCEHTDDVHRVATRFGIKFHNVPGAQLVLENVEKKNRIFYTTSAPLKFYMVLLLQAQEALKPKMQHLIKKGELVLYPI